jgi:hypothetical protein
MKDMIYARFNQIQIQILNSDSNSDSNSESNFEFEFGFNQRMPRGDLLLEHTNSGGLAI